MPTSLSQEPYKSHEPHQCSESTVSTVQDMQDMQDMQGLAESPESAVSANAWWRSPLLLGLLGVVLMIVGWRLTILVLPSSWQSKSISPRLAAQQQQLQDLRDLASDDQTLLARLDAISGSFRPHPSYILLGRLILLGGLVLFLVAAVQLIRPQSPTSEGQRAKDKEAL